jgi:hypothetical protein
MFVGHYGPTFAAKAARELIPLWVVFIAVQLIDVLWASADDRPNVTMPMVSPIAQLLRGAKETPASPICPDLRRICFR